MRTVERRASKWWVKPALALILAGMFMLQWFGAVQKRGPKQPPPFENALVVALAGGFTLTYGIFWLVWLLPSSVAVNERGFTKEKWFMPFDGIAAHAWFPATDFSTLLLVGKDGSRNLFGVPKGDVETKLREILAEKNVPENALLKPFLTTDLKPSTAVGLLTLAPVGVMVALGGALTLHGVLITGLKRELKDANLAWHEDWEKLKSNLAQEGVPIEKLPEEPLGKRPPSKKAMNVQLYLMLAPLVCFVVIAFLAMFLVRSRVEVKNLRDLKLAQFAADGGIPARGGEVSSENSPEKLKPS
jgi:hypothetical protein